VKRKELRLRGSSMTAKPVTKGKIKIKGEIKVFSKKAKMLVLMLTMLMVLSVFIGCSSQPSGQSAPQEKPKEEVKAEEPKGEVKKPIEISWGSSSAGGGYYYATGVLAPIVSEKYDYINVTNIATGASADNVKRILLGELDFGMAHGSNAWEGANGVGQFKGLETDNIRIVSYYMPGPHYFVTLTKNKGINSLKDLEGKTIAMGQPGSGAQYNSDVIIDTLGYKVKREYLQFSDAGRALADGQLEAVGGTGIPVGAISELSETQGVKIIPFTDEEMGKLLAAHSFYYDDKIPAGAYKGIMEPVRVPFVPFFIIAHKDVPDYVVEDVLTTIYDPEVYKKLGDGYGQWKFTRPGLDIMKNSGVKIHPAALKFFEDNVNKYNFDDYGNEGWVDKNK